MRHNVFPITEGQKVVLFPGGNASYYHSKFQYLEGTITRIARKYFYVKLDNCPREEKFELSTFDSKCGDCNAYYHIFASLQDLKNEQERIAMRSKLRTLFSYGSGDNLSYEKIKAVYNIMYGDGKE